MTTAHEGPTIRAVLKSLIEAAAGRLKNRVDAVGELDRLQGILRRSRCGRRKYDSLDTSANHPAVTGFSVTAKPCWLGAAYCRCCRMREYGTATSVSALPSGSG